MVTAKLVVCVQFISMVCLVAAVQIGVIQPTSRSNEQHNLRRAEETITSSPTFKNTPTPVKGRGIDPYNYTCNREERISGRCRWCNREAPNPTGVWAPLPPYWQQPGECSNQAFDVEDTRKCMKGRTLYVMGNSVARQNAFNMVELLGGNPVKREDQRDQCPKHATEWEDSCHSEIAGVKIKYLFMQFMDGFYYDDRGGFPYFRYQTNTNTDSPTWTTGRLSYNDTTTHTTKHYADIMSAHADGDAAVWADDNCSNQGTRACFAKFFAGSTSRDILMFTFGMSYEMRAEGDEPKHALGVDYKAWLEASAASFRAHLGETFKGTVFRATLAEFNKNMFVAPRTPFLARVNTVLNRIWRPGSEEQPWYTIDQWPINRDRHYLYNDHVHFNGPLTHALLHQVLNELCPGGGKDAWQYNTNVTQAMLQYKKTLILRLPMGRNNNWYMVYHNGKRHNIPDMDTFNGLDIPPGVTYDIHNEDLVLFQEGEPLTPCDKDAHPNICPDSVYYKALHGLL